MIGTDRYVGVPTVGFEQDTDTPVEPVFIFTQGGDWESGDFLMPTSVHNLFPIYKKVTLQNSSGSPAALQMFANATRGTVGVALGNPSDTVADAKLLSYSPNVTSGSVAPGVEVTLWVKWESDGTYGDAEISLDHEVA